MFACACVNQQLRIYWIHVHVYFYYSFYTYIDGCENDANKMFDEIKILTEIVMSFYNITFI